MTVDWNEAWNYGSEEVHEALEDGCVVAILDMWRAAGTERKFEEFDFISGEDPPRRIFVFAVETSNEPPGRFARECYRAETPRAARAAAAEILGPKKAQ